MKDKQSVRLAAELFIVSLLFLAALTALYFGYGLLMKKNAQNVAVSEKRSIDVIIDAGHGGRDGGAVGGDGTVEKKLNLEISEKLYDLLTVCGINAAMTRKDDRLVCDENDPSLHGKLKQNDLRNRLAFAEGNSEALFISIHMNTFPIKKYNGLQVYYSKNNEQSFKIAKSIQDGVARYIDTSNTRKAKPAGSSIYLLDRMSQPSVLVECGFLSNDAECQKLTQGDYQKKLCSLFFCVIGENLYNSSNDS